MTDLRPTEIGIGQTVILLDREPAMAAPDFAVVVSLSPLSVRPARAWWRHWPPYIPEAGERIKIMVGGEIVVRTVPTEVERIAA